MDRFFIAPYDSESGLQTDIKPWLIPNQAFSELTNAYVFRGRVRKRFGSRWLGNSQINTRLRVKIDTTDGSGNTSGGLKTPQFSGSPIVTPAIGQMFSIGAQVFTVNVLGVPAIMLISGTATVATFNTTTGAVVIQGADATTDVYYYPALPVMGLLTFDAATINEEPTYAFDTRFAYTYVNSANPGWERLSSEATAGAARWIGTDSDFFWGTTWSGANASDRIFFVTNFNEAETNFMRYYDTQWHNFEPAIDASNFLISARIIVPFKNRLVVFNTWEGANIAGEINYPNRCRYSQFGSPLDSNAWRQDIPGKGNNIDCPITEAIITVEFVKDRLIVFFERSTWELVYTGNQAFPFVWQQINTELGAESTFSIVPFDKVCIGVGNVGIVSCNGSNVERIDNKIPQFVFDIHNDDNGINRVYGIRDYFVEMIYWALPTGDASSTYPYPNRVLVYNYRTGTWALNEDSITAFGYYQATNGITWDSTTVTWDDPVPWDSGEIQAQFRAVIGGNQEGFTFICDSDETINAPALQITDIAITANVITITAINHNLREGEYVYIQDIVGTGNLNLLNNAIFQVIDNAANPLTANTFSFVYQDDAGTIIAGTYEGNGTVARVSNIVVQTKEYNFYGDKGRNAYIQKIEFMVDKTDTGETQVDFYSSTNINSLLDSTTGAIIGTGTLETFPYTTYYPYEADAVRLWHPVFFQAEGEVVSFKLIMNDAQMRDITIREADFQMHAMCIYAQPTSRLQ